MRVCTTDSHLWWMESKQRRGCLGQALVGEVCEELYARRERIAGLRMLWQAPPLRHFTARFERLHQGSPLSEGALELKP